MDSDLSAGSSRAQVRPSALGPLPRMPRRRRVRVAPHGQDERLAAPGSRWTVSERPESMSSCCRASTLSTGARHTRRLGRRRVRGWEATEVDQCDCRPRVGELGHERRYILGHASSLPFGIEVAEAGIDAARRRGRASARPTSAARATRPRPGCSRACCRRGAFQAASRRRAWPSRRLAMRSRSHCSACSGYVGFSPCRKLIQPAVPSDA